MISLFDLIFTSWGFDSDRRGTAMHWAHAVTVIMHRIVIIVIWKVHIGLSINVRVPLLINQTILKGLKGISIWEEEWHPRWGTTWMWFCWWFRVNGWWWGSHWCMTWRVVGVVVLCEGTFGLEWTQAPWNMAKKLMSVGFVWCEWSMAATGTGISQVKGLLMFCEPRLCSELRLALASFKWAR